MADKVGKKTELVTNYGRPVYEMDDGSRVSEISDTFKYKGKIINIPTIHGGRQYSQNELIDMLDAKDIKPTSTHSTFEEAEKAARERSDNMTMRKGKASGGVMMAQQGQTTLPMTQATSAPQGGGPKAANPAAVNPLVAPQQQSARPGEVDPRDGAVQEVAAEMQKKQAPPQPAIQQVGQEMVMPTPPAQPQTGGLAAPAQPPAVPMMAKGGMKDDAPEGLAVMIGLGAPTPSYEEAAEGNPPPGATKEEVADDQLVLLSEGELVVPANVVRYHGLGTYEGMRREALMGLQGMEQNGQIEYVSGGAEKADPIDDNGGLVKAQAGTTLMDPDPFKPRVDGPSTTFGPGRGISPIGFPPNPPVLRDPLMGPVIGGPYMPPTPEAASSRFVTTPTTGGMPRSGATTDTTPLTISNKPYTPTTDLTSVYSPNIDKYKDSTDSDDGDDGDDGTTPPVDPCPPGYKMNAATGVCELIAQRRTGEPSPDDDGDSTNDPSITQTTFFGGYSDGKGSIRGATRYGLTGRTAEPGGMGLASGLFSALTASDEESQKIIVDQNDPNRRAIMSKIQYDFMRDNLGKGGQTGYIDLLMDKQARINADYAKIDPPTGFLGEIGRARRQHQYEHDTAKGIINGLGQKYTGQSLAEAEIVSEAATQNTGIVDYDDSGIPSNIFSDDGAAGTNMGTSADITAQTNEIFNKLSTQGPPSRASGQAFDDSIARAVELAKGERIAQTANALMARGYTADRAYREAEFAERTGQVSLDAQSSFGRTPSVTQASFGPEPTAEEDTSPAVDTTANRQQAMADARAKFERDRQQDADDAATGRGNIVTDSRGRPVTDSSGRPVTTRQGSAARSTPEGDDEINRQAEAMRRDADRREREEASRKSEERVQQKIASGVDAEAAAFESGGNDDSGGKSIVCTEMYRQTQLDDWARTMKIWDTYQKKYLTPTHEVGYHWLFKPYVRGMQKSGILTNVGAFFAQKRTQHLRHILTKGRAKDSFVGNVWCKIIHPIVYLVGKIVSKK